jgi:hypothetical protein
LQPSSERASIAILAIVVSKGIGNTRRLREPLSWVAGSSNLAKPGPGYRFRRKPANPLNRQLMVTADNLGTPIAASEAVLAWLREL